MNLCISTSMGSETGLHVCRFSRHMIKIWKVSISLVWGRDTLSHRKNREFQSHITRRTITSQIRNSLTICVTNVLGIEFHYLGKPLTYIPKSSFSTHSPVEEKPVKLKCSLNGMHTGSAATLLRKITWHTNQRDNQIRVFEMQVLDSLIDDLEGQPDFI